MVNIFCFLLIVESLAFFDTQPKKSLQDNNEYKVMYFSEPLDHINRNSGTIKIKALVREGSSDNRMFVYTGNQGPIEWFYNMTGWLVDYLGPHYDATVVFIQHRYYGESVIQNPEEFTWKYLDTTQALWDFADITMQLKPKQTVPVIAIGGSYGGMLSYMFRLKFPHLVDGAVASSAPIIMANQTGTEFNALVKDVYTQVSPECPKMIWQSFEILEQLVDRELYYPTLEMIFRPCSKITNSTDVKNLENWLVNAFVATAQYSYPYPANVNGPLPGNPVETVCSIFKRHFQKDNIWDAMNALYQFADLFYNGTDSEACFHINTPQSTLDKTWEYQTCSELVFPIGQYGWPNDMFPVEKWNYTQIEIDCEQKYGVTPRLSWTKVNYGMTPDYQQQLQYLTNVVFSYGTNDPWAVGCIQQNFQSGNNVVIGIPEASHHYDLRQQNAEDSVAVLNIRELEKFRFLVWT